MRSIIFSCGQGEKGENGTSGIKGEKVSVKLFKPSLYQRIGLVTSTNLFFRKQASVQSPRAILSLLIQR